MFRKDLFAKNNFPDVSGNKTQKKATREHPVSECMDLRGLLLSLFMESPLISGRESFVLRLVDAALDNLEQHECAHDCQNERPYKVNHCQCVGLHSGNFSTDYRRDSREGTSSPAANRRRLGP